MKTCSSCNTIKSLTDFYIDKRTQTPRSLCKACQNQANQRWRQANKDKVNEQNKGYQLKHKLKNVYNLSEEDYAEAVEAAGGKCQICGVQSKLFIDHCHQSNKFRGLLCTKCNTGLGMFEDNTDRLLAAISYLTE